MEKSFWNKNIVIVAFAMFATILWGSAFPCIKAGYRLFNISSTETASQIFFAGIRFIIAGIMVIAAGSVMEHKILVPEKSSIKYVVLLSLFQTTGQYFFFYIGMANTSGVNSAIIEAANTFFTILFAAVVFKYERFTLKKIAGCILGFSGIILIQLGGKSDALKISLFGDSFILISTLCAAFAVSFIKKFSTDENPVLLSGWQFFTGGICMALCGFLAGGRLHSPVNPAAAYSLLGYMAFISAAAYTMWSLLLKHNDVSKIAVFGFVNPVTGVFLSALILGETSQAFSFKGIIALVLVCLGIVTVFFNTKRHSN